MQVTPLDRRSKAAKWALFVLLASTASFLACHELEDADIWWHLSGGRWILENGRAPGLDPFTFGSADKKWIDIHWLYEVILYLTYSVGGVAGLIVLAAVLGGSSVLVCLTAHRENWSMTVVAACWIPALVLLGFRLDPRPEIFSLFFIGVFLAVLFRTNDRPAMFWLLIPIQILWANMQGLFVFGPVFVGFRLLDRAFSLKFVRLRQGEFDVRRERRWWLHGGGAFVVLVASCLINPYGLEGAMFPLVLFPKVNDDANLYKLTIDELRSVREYLKLKDATTATVSPHYYFIALDFLLLVVPLSFVYPALWRAWRGRTTRGLASTPYANRFWIAGLWTLIVLCGVHAVSPYMIDAAPDDGNVWSWRNSSVVPLGFAAFGLAGAFLVRGRGWTAPVMAILFTLSQSIWAAWLSLEFLHGEDSLLGGAGHSGLMTGMLLICGGVACVAAVRWRAPLFRILVSAAFAYLSIHTLQNWARFALVAGTIMSWNFSEWYCDVRASLHHSGSIGAIPGRLAWLNRGLIAGALVVWIVAICLDRYHVRTGELQHFGFDEKPFAFAHAAAKFAGRPGLPPRAFVISSSQANVYDFHNAPERKPFIDGRFEMPDLHTYRTLVEVQFWMQNQNAKWEQAIADMGNPLILVEHRNNFGAEDALLLNSNWRCIYFDAIASIFVHVGHNSSFQRYPTVDLVKRHFRSASGRTPTDDSGAAVAHEAESLFNLVTALPTLSDAPWRRRIPMALAAIGYGRRAVQDQSRRDNNWLVLGNCYWYLNPDPSAASAMTLESWNIEASIYWAHATYCYRRCTNLEPGNRFAWQALTTAYTLRGMLDARDHVARQWLRSDPYLAADERKQIADANRLPDDTNANLGPRTRDSEAAVVMLLNNHRPQMALQIVSQQIPETTRWQWPLIDRLAGCAMHLGRPELARQIWQNAVDCPSDAIRDCRLAATYWVERNYGCAVTCFRRAATIGPQLAEPWWGLAMISAESGDAIALRNACRQGLMRNPNPRQRTDFEGLEQLLTRIQ